MLNIVILHIKYLVYKLTLNHAYPVWTPIFLWRLNDNEVKFDGKVNKTRPHHQCGNLSQSEGEKKEENKSRKETLQDIIIADGS